MDHFSLFNGIGGFMLAAQWVGWNNIAYCEKDLWCNQVTRKNFENCFEYEDIKKADFRIWKNRIDIVSGGDPCQPSSISGKRKGTKDSRYLWPEMLRFIREVEPPWVVNENVPGTISNGLLDIKISDLENENYTCWPPFVIPSGALGTDHKRKRVWLVAYSNSKRGERSLCSNKGMRTKQSEKANACDSQIITYDKFEKRFSQPLLLSDKDGIPAGLDNTRTINHVGNAIVPQLAYEIFKIIDKIERDDRRKDNNNNRP